MVGGAAPLHVSQTEKIGRDVCGVIGMVHVGGDGYVFEESFVCDDAVTTNTRQ